MIRLTFSTRSESSRFDRLIGTWWGMLLLFPMILGGLVALCVVVFGVPFSLINVIFELKDHTFVEYLTTHPVQAFLSSVGIFCVSGIGYLIFFSPNVPQRRSGYRRVHPTTYGDGDLTQQDYYTAEEIRRQTLGSDSDKSRSEARKNDVPVFEFPSEHLVGSKVRVRAKFERRENTMVIYNSKIHI